MLDIVCIRNIATASGSRICITYKRQKRISTFSSKGFSWTDPLRTVKFGIYEKLSCRREAARRSVSLKILLSYSRSCKSTPLSRACVSYFYSILTVPSIVSEMFDIE